MSIETPTGSDPKENAGGGESLSDVLDGKGHPEGSQSADTPTDPSKDGDHSDKTGDAGKKPNEGKKPDETPRADAGDKGDDGTKPSGKYATLEEANKGYGELSKKFAEQSTELGTLRTSVKEQENVQTFLSTLDKALAANPDLHDQLKAALAAAVGGNDGDGGTDDSGDESIKATVEKIIDEREAKSKVKAGIDAWMEEHKTELEADESKLGHAILDTIEKDKLPFNAKTLQLVYDALTGDKKAKKAAEDALKKEEIADLDRENASAVGDGSPAPKGNIPDEGFSSIVGGIGNPNRL